MNDSKRKLAQSHEEAGSDDPRRWLSALADGQAEAAAPACKAWRDDAQARQTWHAYHLIGDVLRSDELAQRPAHDAAFLASLRQKLAAEPVILAPAASKPSRQPWLVPAAVAAGFVVVAGVLVVSRLGLPETGQGASMAAASSAGYTVVGNAGPAAATAPRLVGGPLIRDARLDEYLRAHQSALAGVAVAAPGGALRRVEALAPAGAPQ